MTIQLTKDEAEEALAAYIKQAVVKDGKMVIVDICIENGDVAIFATVEDEP